MNRNGLTSITIENFKGIGAPVTVPLRPLTLLFGANSAGKSTIVQALQYAWEVLENRNPDVDRTRIGGEVIDLGGFRSLVHKHDLERPIKITLEYQGRLMNDSIQFVASARKPQRTPCFCIVPASYASASHVSSSRVNPGRGTG